MLPAALAIALLLGAQTGAAPSDEATVWAQTHTDAMELFRSWADDWSLYTPAFRRCVDVNLRAGKPTSTVGVCLNAERQVRDAEAGRKAERERQARFEDAQREAKERARTVAAEREAAAEERREAAEARERDYKENRPEAIKKWMGAVLGYRVALAENRREEAKTEIAKEKKYSRVGGVVNKSAIYEAQQKIRWADEDIEERRQTARDEGVKILGRNDKRVSAVEECLDASYDHERSSSITKTDIDRIIGSAGWFTVEGQDCLWIILLIKETEPK
jgi:hypothetical protein